MAEIKPVPFREVQPRTSHRGGAAGAAEGVADVLGFLGGVRDNNLVEGHIENTKQLIKDINEDDPEQLEDRSKDGTILDSFHRRMRKLEATAEQGDTNQQHRAKLEAKKLLEKNISAHPRLRDRFIQGTSSTFAISADFQELGVEDAYRTMTSRAAQADLDAYKARGIEMGIPDSLFGTEEWNRQYVKLDFQYARSKQYEINFLLRTQDAESTAEQLETAFNNLVVGPNAPVTLGFRSVFQKLNTVRAGVRAGDAALDIEMQTGLGERLKQDVLQVMMEAENAYHMGFSGLKQDSNAADRARATLDQRLEYGKLLIKAIDDDDTSLLKRLEYEEEVRARLMTNNDPALKFISVLDKAVGIERLGILNNIVGLEDLEFFDKLGIALKGSFTNVAESMGVTLSSSGDFKGSPHKVEANIAIAERNLPPASDPKTRAKELASRVEEQTITASILNEHSDPLFVRGTFGALASHIAILNRDRVDTKQSFDSVVELATDRKVLDNIERYREDGSYHEELINLGNALGDYVVHTVYPSFETRNAKYESVLEDYVTTVDTDGKAGVFPSYVKLRDLIELDKEALSTNTILFKLKDTKSTNPHRRSIFKELQQLNKMINEDVSLYHMFEQLKTPEEDVPYEAVLERFRFSEILFGNSDQ